MRRSCRDGSAAPRSMAAAPATNARVNLRAKTGFDVGSVARHFGGGGHKAASGLTWDGTIDTLLPVLLPMLPGSDRA